MIPDHANPAKLPLPIGPPAPLSMTRSAVRVASIKLGLRPERVWMEALGCNPMKYRVTVLTSQDVMITATRASWAEALAAVRAHIAM